MTEQPGPHGTSHEDEDMGNNNGIGNNTRAIDINEALAILNLRTATKKEGEDPNYDGDTPMTTTTGGGRGVGGGCGCSSSDGKASESKMSMGQRIHLFDPDNDDVSERGGDGGDGAEKSKATCLVEEEEQLKAMREESKERKIQMRQHLETLAVAELLRAVFEAQRERTATYAEFDRSLQTVLDTGNITLYPAACAKATASFAVLSNSINAIRDVLVGDRHKDDDGDDENNSNHRRRREDLGKLLDALQRHEKDKLNLTAALHLERIRERDESGKRHGGEGGCGAPGSSSSTGDDDSHDDDELGNGRIRQLLRDGIVSLRGKVATCVEAINETLEELRYAAAAAEEEEED